MVLEMHINFLWLLFILVGKIFFHFLCPLFKHEAFLASK